MSALVAEKRLLVLEAAGLVGQALALIGSPARWTKHQWALDRRGKTVRVDDPTAVRFCLVGALLRAEHDLFQVEPDYAEVLRAESPAVANPTGRLAAVLDLLSFDVRAILEGDGVNVELLIAAEPATADREVPFIHFHNLPIAFNGLNTVGHRQIIVLLGHVAALLANLLDNPDWLERLVPDSAVTPTEGNG